jgi:hypothetical protein
MDAHNFLQDAINDYNNAYARYTDLNDGTELTDELTKWSNRPALPKPEHPTWPSP